MYICYYSFSKAWWKPDIQEKGKIAGLSFPEWSMEKIARAIFRSRTVVANFLKAGRAFRKDRENSGRKAKRTPRVKREILWLDEIEVCTSRKICKTPQLGVDTSSICSMFSKLLRFKCWNSSSCIPPTFYHCNLRCKWAMFFTLYGLHVENKYLFWWKDIQLRRAPLTVLLLASSTKKKARLHIKAATWWICDLIRCVFEVL